MPKPQRGTFDALLGARLKAARQAAGLSQARLAETLDLTVQQVQKYEKGTSRVTPYVLALAAAALGVGLGDLVPALGDAALPFRPSPQRVGRSASAIAEAEAIAEAVALCSPSVRRAVLALCSAARRLPGAEAPADMPYPEFLARATA